MNKMFYRLFLAVALMLAVPAFTSCDKIAEAIGDNYDFKEATRCFSAYSDYNSDKGIYEKFFSSKTEAREACEKYTNNKMNIPGTWKWDSEDIITIEEGTSESVYYVIKVESKLYDRYYHAYFKKK